MPYGLWGKAIASPVYASLHCGTNLVELFLHFATRKLGEWIFRDRNLHCCLPAEPRNDLDSMHVRDIVDTLG